jgi:L-lactate dehydrogenase complex protein LldG
MKRELFLDAIAAKLGRKRGAAPGTREVRGVGDAYRERPLGTDPRALVDRFQSELERVGGIVARCASTSEVEERLLALIAETKAESLVSWSRSELASWPLERLWRTDACTPWEGGDERERARFRDRAARAHIGITTADLAIANTGSLVLRGGPARPRSVSLLPSMHVALLDSSRIVARMGEALARLATRDAIPSSLVFITGPSRTSDIENDLTIGVHGPASVVVLIRDRASA